MGHMSRCKVVVYNDAVAQSRGVGLGAVGLIFSIYAFANFAVSPYLGKALQTG